MATTSSPSCAEPGLASVAGVEPGDALDLQQRHVVVGVDADDRRRRAGRAHRRGARGRGAPSTTWALVSTSPSAVRMMPVPTASPAPSWLVALSVAGDGDHARRDLLDDPGDIEVRVGELVGRSCDLHAVSGARRGRRVVVVHAGADDAAAHAGGERRHDERDRPTPLAPLVLGGRRRAGGGRIASGRAGRVGHGHGRRGARPRAPRPARRRPSRVSGACR